MDNLWVLIVMCYHSCFLFLFLYLRLSWNRFGVSTNLALFSLNRVKMLASPASPLITIITISDSHTSFLRHHVFLLFLLYLHLSFLALSGPQQLSAVAVAGCLSRHIVIIIKLSPYMLNPIKHLAGKLNHLHIPQTRYLRIVELANSIRPSTESKGL